MKRQTYGGIECIVIDGGSSDGTVEVIKEYRSIVAYWKSEQDSGIYSAMNKGIRNACGEWFCFLGAGDFFVRHDIVGLVADALRSMRRENKIAYGQVLRYLPEGKVLDCAGLPWEKAQRAIGRRLSICHQGVFHRASFFKEYGLFDETFKIAGDYDCLLRYLKNHDPAYFAFPVVAKELSGITVMPGTAMLNFRERVKARRNNGIAASPLQLAGEYCKTAVEELLLGLLGLEQWQKIIDVYRKVAGRTLPLPFPEQVFRECIPGGDPK